MIHAFNVRAPGQKPTEFTLYWAHSEEGYIHGMLTVHEDDRREQHVASFQEPAGSTKQDELSCLLATAHREAIKWVRYGLEITVDSGEN